MLRSTHNLLNGLVFFALGMLLIVLIMIVIIMIKVSMTMLIMTVIAMTMLTMVRAPIQPNLSLCLSIGNQFTTRAKYWVRLQIQRPSKP